MSLSSLSLVSSKGIVTVGHSRLVYWHVGAHIYLGHYLKDMAIFEDQYFIWRPIFYFFENLFWGYPLGHFFSQRLKSHILILLGMPSKKKVHIKGNCPFLLLPLPPFYNRDKENRDIFKCTYPPPPLLKWGQFIFSLATLKAQTIKTEDWF